MRKQSTITITLPPNVWSTVYMERSLQMFVNFVTILPTDDILTTNIVDHQYASDKYYAHLSFGTGRFISNQSTGGGFCRDAFFLKGVSECIIETVSSPDMPQSIISTNK